MFLPMSLDSIQPVEGLLCHSSEELIRDHPQTAACLLDNLKTALYVRDCEADTLYGNASYLALLEQALQVSEQDAAANTAA